MGSPFPRGWCKFSGDDAPELDPFSWPLPFTPAKKGDKTPPAEAIPEAIPVVIPEAMIVEVAATNLEPQVCESPKHFQSEQSHNNPRAMSPPPPPPPLQQQYPEATPEAIPEEMSVEVAATNLKPEVCGSPKHFESEESPRAMSPPVQAPIQSLSYESFWAGRKDDPVLDPQMEKKFFGPIGSGLHRPPK